ncbi:MAG: peptidyl-prolyl cis-trans isomerase [Burkholderiaceae bacterium]|uniref:peptidylprolyl isomerase n=1 Tax=Rubrivivax albus TaxID=2499835 RepID=UPI0018EEBD8E|nr:peptidyl-prolyl cis-trans isomerase [Rhodoferax sp.]MCP5272465.1 peptidyl-prolyl cis-trans isomerase [Burkholderiaceae bacterium]
MTPALFRGSPVPRFTALLLAGLTSMTLALPAWAQKVRLATSAGDIVVEVDAAKAPKSAENFVAYVKAGHYDGTIFHRVIDGFMIQGGGFTKDMAQKPTRPPIPLEAGNGLSNQRGTLAMARTGDPNSATAQFFINVVDNPRLDSYGGGYAVFGRVIAGMDVVDKIRTVPVGNRAGHQNVPLEPVTITKATLEN